MAKLSAIANKSQAMLNAQAMLKPICRQEHECVGWGVDGVTGAPAPFPIVHLSYDPSRWDKTYNGMSEPIEVESNHIVTPVWASTDGAKAFPRMEDFVEHVNTIYRGATPQPKSTRGIYSRGFENVLQNYFQKSDDRALAVVRASKSLIEMSLPLDDDQPHRRRWHP
jgi:hypothetical protein